MLKKNTDLIKDAIVKDLFDFVFEEVSGNIIELDAAPTADVPLLEHNERGKYGNNLYFRIGNTILVFASDSQITVT